MMLCQACGASLPPSAARCPRCGTPSGTRGPGTRERVLDAAGADAAPVGAVPVTAAGPNARMSVALPSGTVLNGRYRVVRVLGTGAFGRVYLAEDAEDGNSPLLAIKELLAMEFASSEEQRDAMSWFKREVSALLTLEHPGIPAIHGYWTAHRTDGPLYLAMDYIPGKTLAEIHAEHGGRVPWQQVAIWGAALCEVLGYLHSRVPPFVFRDLKPANVLIDSRTNAPVLIDFGLARQVVPAGGTAVGTWGYVPYEQVLGKAEPRSDLYALGAMLHALLTGRQPDVEYRRLLRTGLDLEGALRALFPPVESCVVGVPSALGRVIATATAFSAEDRFAGAATMTTLLRNVVAMVDPATQGPAAAAGAPPPVGALPPLDPVVPPASGRPPLQVTPSSSYSKGRKISSGPRPASPGGENVPRSGPLLKGVSPARPAPSAEVRGDSTPARAVGETDVRVAPPVPAPSTLQGVGGEGEARAGIPVQSAQAPTTEYPAAGYPEGSAPPDTEGMPAPGLPLDLESLPTLERLPDEEGEDFSPGGEVRSGALRGPSGWRVDPARPKWWQRGAQARASGPLLERVRVSARGEGDCVSIGEAIQRAKPGARIEVAPGRYSEGFLLDRRVEIVGVGPAADVVVEVENSGCVMMQTAEATIRGLTLRCLRGEERFHAVTVPMGRLVLEDCRVESSSLACVVVHGAETRPALLRCVLRGGSEPALVIYSSARGLVEDCDITAGTVPVRVSGLAQPTFHRCRIHHGRFAGVAVGEQGGGRFEDCDIVRNGHHGVVVRRGGTPTLRRCRIMHNGWCAISLADKSGAIVEHCDLRENRRGPWDVRDTTRLRLDTVGNTEY